MCIISDTWPMTLRRYCLAAVKFLAMLLIPFLYEITAIHRQAVVYRNLAGVVTLMRLTADRSHKSFVCSFGIRSMDQAALFTNSNNSVSGFLGYLIDRRNGVTRANTENTVVVGYLMYSRSISLLKVIFCTNLIFNNH